MIYDERLISELVLALQGIDYHECFVEFHKESNDVYIDEKTARFNEPDGSVGVMYNGKIFRENLKAIDEESVNDFLKGFGRT